MHNWLEWPDEVPDTMPMRLADRWIGAESALEWLDCDPVRAANTRALGFQIARHAAEDRSLISFLLAKSIEESTLRGLRYMLLRGGDRPANVRAVRRALETMGEPPSVVQAMSSELASSVGKVGIDPDNMDGLYVREGWPRTQFGPSMRNVARFSKPQRNQWDTELYGAALELRRYRTLISPLDLPYPQAQSQFLKNLTTFNPSSATKGRRVGDEVGDICLPTLVSRTELLALYNTTEGGAAVLEYRSKHGRLPSTLDKALSPVPLDPFDLKPLRYRLEGKGFVVYSIGQTGRINGGTAATIPNPRESVFRWPAPSYVR